MGARPAAFDGELDSLVNASRVLVALSVRTLGTVEPPVTAVQLRTLVLLSSADGVPMGQLAEALGVHPSNVTRLCDRLARMDLVHRTEKPDDRRTLHIELTERGRRLLDRLMTQR